MTPELSQALESAAVFGAAIRPLLVGTILLGLWHALARSGLPAHQRLRAWGAVAVILTGWLIAVWTLASRGTLSAASGASPADSAAMIVVPTILVVAVVLTLLTRSSSVTSAIDAAPVWWLVAYQGYRVAGFIFLRVWWQGFLPGYFALPAGIGDALTGVFATVAVAAFLRDSSWARGFAYAVNIFGMVDLVNAMSMGVLATLSGGNQAYHLLLYPIVMVPTFGVPVAFIIHCLSLWQLSRRRVSSAISIQPECAVRRSA